MNTHLDIQNRVKTFAFTIAIVASPFLALLISVTFAVVVLSFAMLVTIWLVMTAARQAAPDEARRLRVVAAILGLLLVMIVGVTIMFRLG